MLPMHLECYFLYVGMAALAIRMIMTVLRNFEHHYPAKIDTNGAWIFLSMSHREHNFFWNCLQDFFGRHPEAMQRDWLQSFFLGLLELSAYPVLMASHQWSAIGGWVLLKTVAQWEGWKTWRGHYNRFLIGNALVLGTAYVFYVCPWFFKMPTTLPPCG